MAVPRLPGGCSWGEGDEGISASQEGSGQPCSYFLRQKGRPVQGEATALPRCGVNANHPQDPLLL